MKQTTEFIRVIKDKNFSVINNEFLRRNDLSWKAKGILAYILTLPDDWVINLKEVLTHATEGERAFRSGWKELTDLGYVERKAVRKGNRIDYWETIIREKPDTKGKPELCGFEEVQNEDVQNVHVQSEDVQNDKLLNTNNTKDLSIPSTKDTNIDDRFEYIWSKYPRKVGKQKAYHSYKKAVKDGTTNEEIEKGVDNYIKHIEANKIQGKYVKHGSTWFNNRSWEDEYELAKVRNDEYDDFF